MGKKLKATGKFLAVAAIATGIGITGMNTANMTIEQADALVKAAARQGWHYSAGRLFNSDIQTYRELEASKIELKQSWQNISKARGWADAWGRNRLKNQAGKGVLFGLAGLGYAARRAYKRRQKRP